MRLSRRWMRRVRRAVRRHWRLRGGKADLVGETARGRPQSPLTACGALVSLAEGWAGRADCGYNTINPVTLIEAVPVVIETYDWVIV